MRWSGVQIGLSLLLAAGVSACSPPPLCTGFGGGAPTGSPTTVFATLGDRAVHSMALPMIVSGCEPPAVEWVRVEVTDPARGHVDAEVALVSSSPPTARVSFTPEQLGVHNVRVLFEPNLGSAQEQILVVRDLRKKEVTRLPAACRDVLPLSAGAYLCDGVLYRGEADPVELDPEANWTTDGSALWSISAGSVRRWVDNGDGTLTESGSLLQDELIGTTLHLVAQGDVLWVLQKDKLARFTHASGVVSRAGELSVDMERALLPHEGGVLLAASGTIQGMMSLCPVQLTSGGALELGAWTELTGFVHGVDGDGLWLHVPEAVTPPLEPPLTGGALWRVTVQDGAPIRQIVARLPPDLGPTIGGLPRTYPGFWDAPLRGPPLLQLKDAWLALWMGEEGPQYELITDGRTGATPGLAPTLAWGRSGAAETTVHARGP